MSLSAYAKHRGVSPKAVSKAVAEGRLLASVVRGSDGSPKILDADLADREWNANSRERRDPWRLDAGKSTAAAAKKSAVDRARLEWARARREAAMADLAEIRAEAMRTSYLPRDFARSDISGLFTRIRERVLEVVPRTAERCPQLKPPQLALIEGLIKECLEEINDESVDQMFGVKGAGAHEIEP